MMTQGLALLILVTQLLQLGNCIDELVDVPLVSREKRSSRNTIVINGKTYYRVPLERRKSPNLDFIHRFVGKRASDMPLVAQSESGPFDSSADSRTIEQLLTPNAGAEDWISDAPTLLDLLKHPQSSVQDNTNRNERFVPDYDYSGGLDEKDHPRVNDFQKRFSEDMVYPFVGKRQKFDHLFVGKRDFGKLLRKKRSTNSTGDFDHAFVGKREPGFSHAFVGKREPGFSHAFVGKREPGFSHAFVGKREPGFSHAFVGKREPGFNHAFVGKREPGFSHAFVGKREPGFNHAFVGKREPGFNHAFVGKRELGFSGDSSENQPDAYDQRDSRR